MINVKFTSEHGTHEGQLVDYTTDGDLGTITFRVRGGKLDGEVVEAVREDQGSDDIGFWYIDGYNFNLEITNG